MFQLNFVIDKKYTHPVAVSQTPFSFIHFYFSKKSVAEILKNSKVEVGMNPPRFLRPPEPQ